MPKLATALIALALPVLAGFAPFEEGPGKAAYPSGALHAGCRAPASMDRDGESQLGQSQWRLGWYEIDGEIFFDPDLEDGVLAGTVRIHITPEQPTDSLVLDALWNVEVLDARLNGVPADFRHDGIALLSVDTPGLVLGEEVIVEVDYEARENEDGFGAFVFEPYSDDELVRHPLLYTMTQTQYAGSWWPCIDRLDFRADSLSVRITVPEDLVVASNGTLESIEDLEGSRRRYHWMERYSIPSYLVAITVTDFWSPADDGRPFVETYEFPDGHTMPLTLFAFKHHQEEGLLHFERVTADQMDCFNARFGDDPYRNEKYGIAEYRFSGGMEHMTLSSIGSTTLAGEDSISHVLPHELTHQWFGDQVTCASWEDIWLNEGFATYGEALYYEHAGRWTPGDYLYAMRWRESFEGTVYDPVETFGRTSYWKGAWVLHMLRGRLRHHFDENAESYAFGESEGDALFYGILRSWAQESPFSFSAGTTEDFIGWAESMSGLNLRPFFERWLYDTGRPFYFRNWSTRESGAEWDTEVLIRQVQPGALFSEPLDLMFRFEGGDSLVETVLPDQVEQRYDFTLPSRPVALELDPHHKVLHRVVSYDGALMAEPPFPNPFGSTRGTTLRVNLLEESWVRASIHDVAGRRVKLLHEGYASPPFLDLRWNGKDDRNGFCSYGIFLLRVEANDQIQSQKLVFLPVD